MSDARAEIATLIFRCDQLNDDGDFDGVGALFAHGAIAVEGMGEGVCSGAEQTAAQFRAATQVYESGGARTHHLSTNLIIEVDEDAGTASCQSHYVMYQQTDALPLQPINAGRNYDTFERVDGVWRWKRRYIKVMFVGDMSHHLKADTTPFT
jgi:SnoaL-like domain